MASASHPRASFPLRARNLIHPPLHLTRFFSSTPWIFPQLWYITPHLRANIPRPRLPFSAPYRPPTITAPAPQTYNATSAAGATVQLLPEANKTCGVPTCTVYVLVNGTKYNVSDTVNVPVGNTTVTYVIVDALGVTANSTTTVTVLPPLYVQIRC